ncbi:MAG TPA: DUF5665 domain-containing protein [Candidatus Saccharimonadales bacterium]|jgi:hypothetical protein
MGRLKAALKQKKDERDVKNEKEAKKAVLEELFNDIYHERGKIYKVNFVRGILFGAGSALGGTVVIALIVWALSLFVHIPVIGNTFQNAQQSIEQGTQTQ